MGESTAGERLRVRVWFGQSVIVDRTTTKEQAPLYARAMERRFAGLPITIEPAHGEVNRGPHTPLADHAAPLRAAL